jgi:hypothetical protein
MKLFWLQTPFTWIASLSEFADFHPKAKIIKRVKPEVRRLCSHLLGIGGDRVVVFHDDLELCEPFVAQGKVLSYKKLRITGGEERECHRNCAALWLRNPGKYKIGTGFGLSEDQTWRRHSWIVTSTGDLIETTLAREVYFGIMLDGRGAKLFAETYT